MHYERKGTGTGWHEGRRKLKTGNTACEYKLVFASFTRK